METTYLNNKKALFKECKAPTREPDWIESDKTCYWEERDFLYRESVNWSSLHSHKEPIFNQYTTGNVGNNKLGFWLNEPIKLSKDNKPLCGRVKWENITNL